MTINNASLELELLRLVDERGPAKSVCPSEPARIVGGPSGDAWGALMPKMRRIAVRLAKEGRIVITRKGKIVDPDDFKGVYRIAATRLE